MTIFNTVKSMPHTGTGIRSPRYHQVSVGMATTANRVEHKVSVIDNATSPLAR